VLAVLPGIIPSTVISVIKPFIELHRGRYISTKIALEAFTDQRDLEQADLVVFCRNTEPTYRHILEFVLRRGIPYIYDLDDNFFDIPGSSPIARYHRAPEQLALLNRYVTHASLVRVYSNALFEKVQTLNPSVQKVVGPLDLRLIPKKVPDSDRRRTRLVYATSRRSDDDFEDVYLPPVVRVLQEYHGRVEMHFWGHQPSRLRGCDGVYYHSPIADYDRFLRTFAKSAYDIGLAPLHDDIFCRSKSNNKFREYGGCDIAGVYSKVDVYTDCVEDGETGLLVPNSPEAWYSAIVQLIEDDDLRKKIGRQARNYVCTHYSQRKFERVWYDQIRGVLDGCLSKGRPVSQAPDGSILFGLDILAKLLIIVRYLRSRNPGAALQALLYYKHQLLITIRMQCRVSHPVARLAHN
jgi:hypothetical protein